MPCLHLYSIRIFVYFPRSFFCRKTVTKGKLINGLCVDQVYLNERYTWWCVGFGACSCKFNRTQHVTWESETGNPNEVDWPWV